MENALLTALLTRRSVKPKLLTAPAPSVDDLKLAARAALRAPVHHTGFACRFVLVEEAMRKTLAELLRAAALRSGADAEKAEHAASKAFKGPQIVAFVANCPEGADDVESLVSAGAALEQFLLALKAMGYGAIALSGSLFQDAALQQAFCKAPGEKLVCWLTTGTPAEGTAFAPEEREGAFEIWQPQAG